MIRYDKVKQNIIEYYRYNMKGQDKDKIRYERI